MKRALRPLFALALACASCARRDAVPAGPLVAVSLPPLAGVVEAVAGGDVAVATLLGPGDDPHTFEPTPRTMDVLRRADLHFAGAMPFEEILSAKIAARRFSCRAVSLADGAAHEVDAGGHGHDEAALHAWLSPTELREMAGRVRDALSARYPEKADAFAARAATYVSRIETVRSEAAAKLAGCCGFVAVHPAYGAFAESFGLTQFALEANGQETGARHLSEIRRRAAEAGATVIVLQAEAETRAAEAFRRGGAFRTVVVPPLGRDALATIRALADALSQEDRR